MHNAGQGNSTIWVLAAGGFTKVRVGSWEIFKAYEYVIRKGLRMWIKAVPGEKQTEFAVYDATKCGKNSVHPLRQFPTFGAAIMYAAIQGAG